MLSETDSLYLLYLKFKFMRRKIKVVWTITCVLVAFIFNLDSLNAANKAKVGKSIPAWKEGYLDIHFINTGTGESSFIIMPDGTQLLVDMAGAVLTPEEDPMWIKPMPDDSRRPGEWINRYVARCMKWTKNEKIDYVSITHTHGDHMGNCPERLPKSPKGNWQAMSVTDVLDGNKVGKLVDRAYPDYTYPRDMNDNLPVSNYLKCARWHVATGSMKMERFLPGSDTQFAMLYDGDSYPEFKIRNIAANGQVWTGKGLETKCAFPDQSAFEGRGKGKEPSPAENILSSVFKLSYGKFDYYAGGDASHNGAEYFDWKDVETPIADAVGCVEVMKANHHGSKDANNDYILRTLSPQTVIINVWRNVQPTGGIRKYLGPEVNGGKTDLFMTNLLPEVEESFGDDMSRVLSKQGHIVVRVAPGGDSYSIIVLRDSDESMKVTGVFGPYYCR